MEFWISGLTASGLSAGKSPFVIQQPGALNDFGLNSSKDAVIRVWDRQTLELHRTLRGHEGPVNAVGLQSGRVVRVLLPLILTQLIPLVSGQRQRGWQDDPVGYRQWRTSPNF